MNGANNESDGSALMTNANPAPLPLQAEIQTAQAAFKTALLQLGLLGRFQRDVKALGVEDYASRPPSTLKNALAQALKSYEEACDSMELQIMRAKAALLYEPDMEDEKEGIDVTENNADKVADAITIGDSPMEGDAQAAADSTASIPNEPTPLQAPPTQDTASLLNNDEMEDLFGPGTGKTTDTSMSTPAYPGTLQTQQDQAIAVTEAQQEQSSHSEQPSFIASLAAPALPTTLSSSSQGNDNNVLPSAPAQAADQAASMFDFGNIGPTDNGSSALPDTNFDFSHMTSDDFNSLLASLGASGGGDGQVNNGNDLLSGLNLDTDLSSFLNSNINPNP